MKRAKLELIDAIINILDDKEVNALYEVVIMEDWDYIEDLFPTKQEFKEFIEKFREGDQ